MDHSNWKKASALDELSKKNIDHYINSRHKGRIALLIAYLTPIFLVIAIFFPDINVVLYIINYIASLAAGMLAFSHYEDEEYNYIANYKYEWNIGYSAYSVYYPLARYYNIDGNQYRRIPTFGKISRIRKNDEILVLRFKLLDQKYRYYAIKKDLLKETRSSKAQHSE